MKVAIVTNIFANTGLLLVGIVFNFTYGEENSPTCYYIWPLSFYLFLYISNAAVTTIMFFIVFGPDRSLII
jgi:hypothetical protein